MFRLAPIAPVISVTQWVTRKQEADHEEEVTKEPPTDPGDGPTGAGSGGPAPSGSLQRQAGDPNFHGEKFSNATHRSKTDPDARIARKGRAQEAKLRYLVGAGLAR